MKLFDRKCTVYYFVNIFTQEKYVGSTTNFASRKRHHLSELRLRKHRSEKLQTAYNQYGENAFRFVALETFVCGNEKELYKREQFWIDTLHPEYNMNPVAGNYFNEKARSEFARQKQIKAVTGRKQTQEEKDKRAESIKKFWNNHPAKIIPQEMRNHLSKINTGKNNPNWGLKRSKETCKKLSDGNARITRVGFVSPDGVEFRKIANLGWFCKEHNLSYWGMNDLDKGERKSYKGWTKVQT